MEKDHIKEIFDNAAETYNKTWQKLAPINNSLHLLMGAAFVNLPQQARILCVGAGTGAEIVYLAKRFPHWQFTAVDPSAAMLEVCRKQLQELGMLDRCEFYADYLENLSLEPNYDAATSILVSQFISDEESRSAFFRCISAQLKPKGVLISADLSSDMNSNEYEYEHILKIWASMMIEGEVASQSIDKIRQSHQNGVSILAPQKIAGIIESAGFEKPILFYQMAFIHAWYCQKKHVELL